MEGVIVFIGSAIVCGIIQLIRYKNNVNSWNDYTLYRYISIVMRALMTISLTVVIGLLLALFT